MASQTQPSGPTKYCHSCGATIDARTDVCPDCGVRQPGIGSSGGGLAARLAARDATTRTGKSKLTASFLALFLGILGIHKFYLGDTLLGVVYLIFFWTMVPAVLGLIEGIVWLRQSNEIWLAKYGDR